MLICSADTKSDFRAVVERSHVFTSITVVCVSKNSTTSHPVLHLTAVAVGLLIVHSQRGCSVASTGVSNVRQRDHHTLECRSSTQESRIVQQLPVVLVKRVSTTGEALKAELHSHVSVVLKSTELSRKASRNTRRNAACEHIVNGEVLLAVQIQSVLSGSALLVELDDDVVKLCEAIQRVSVSIGDVDAANL